jgi:hypothetical protein
MRLSKASGCDIDCYNFRGLPDNPVRHRFAQLDAGDLPYLVIEAFDVLDIHCGPHFDASVQQEFNVFPTLGANRARDVGMRQFVDQRDAWSASQYGLRVHLLKCFAAVFDLGMRHNLESLGLSNRVGARVRFKVGNDNVDSPLRSSVAIRKHLESLADTRGIAQIDLQYAALDVVGCRHI